jgi:hypothetical protein
MSVSTNFYSQTTDATDIFFSDGDSAGPGEADLGNIFDGVLEAHRQEGFDAGYRRGTSDLLAEFVLISEEFIREQAPGSPHLREILRSLGERLEQSAGAVSKEHFVDGGLGI